MMTYAYLRTLTLGFAVAASLSACSTSGCTGDPRTDGFFCAATHGQAYQTKLEETRAVRIDLEQRAAELRRLNAQLEGELDQLTADEQRLNEALRRTNNRLADLADRLSAIQTRTSASQAELQLANERLLDLEERQQENSADPQYDAAMIDEMNAVNNEISEIEDAIAALDG